MARKRNEPDLYFRADNGVWYTTFYDAKGKRRRVSTHQAQRSLAVAAARRIQQDHFTPPAPSVTLEKVLADYISSRDRSGCSSDTADYYLKKSKNLVRVLGGDRLVNELELADTEGYVDIRDKEGVARTTSRKEIDVLVWALTYARKQRVGGRRLYDGDPKDLIPEGLGGGYVPRERALDHAEYAALRAQLRPDRREHLDAYVGLGLRDSELYRLRPSGLLEDGAQIAVPGTKTKGAARVLAVTESLQPTLRARASARRDDAPLFEPWSNMRRDLLLACERAGIPRLSPNDLRRTFATWLAEAGVPEITTAQLLGHTTSAMVRRVYAKIGTAAKADAVAKLPTLGAPPAVTVARPKRQAPKRTVSTKARPKKPGRAK